MRCSFLCSSFSLLPVDSLSGIRVDVNELRMYIARQDELIIGIASLGVASLSKLENFMDQPPFLQAG